MLWLCRFFLATQFDNPILAPHKPILLDFAPCYCSLSSKITFKFGDHCFDTVEETVRPLHRWCLTCLHNETSWESYKCCRSAGSCLSLHDHTNPMETLAKFKLHMVFDFYRYSLVIFWSHFAYPSVICQNCAFQSCHKMNWVHNFISVGVNVALGSEVATGTLCPMLVKCQRWEFLTLSITWTFASGKLIGWLKSWWLQNGHKSNCKCSLQVEKKLPCKFAQSTPVQMAICELQRHDSSFTPSAC